MPPQIVRFFLALTLLLMPGRARATHLVGGELEMRAVGDQPGHYRVIVTNYFEDGFRADQQTGGQLGLFRRRDNQLMRSFRVRQTGPRQPVIYANVRCAELRNLRFIRVTFEAELQLDPAHYADAQGYYLSFQTRHRNAGIGNIVNPLQTGFTFYLAFPALQQNGRAVPYSSPRFPPLNGEYICVGEPFTFPLGGTDPDGDELRYAMGTPLDEKIPGPTPDPSPGPYPGVRWGPGYGPTNAIPGRPALSIDARTGQLSVTASEVGLFVFAVTVAEYRNGVKIGEVQRDFQFLVVDCPPTTAPDPAVRVRNQPLGVRDVSLCRGDSATLQAAADPAWNYQWQRDGTNLPNATGASLTVGESGAYRVVVSSNETCGKAGSSPVLTIRVIGKEAVLQKTGHLCAASGSVDLTVTRDTGVTYQWYRNDRRLTDPVTDSVRTEQDGRYQAVLIYPPLGCPVRSNTLSISRSAAVRAVIRSATGGNRLCPSDSLPLLSSGGTRYAWHRDGQLLSGATTARYRAQTAGSYVVTVTDGYGCAGVSEPFVVVPVPPVTVRFDSIPGVCGPDAPAFVLRASPAGGVFAGPGVLDGTFSPQRAGLGDHALTYTVKPAPECAGAVATRRAVVAPIPTVQLPPRLVAEPGSTRLLTPVYGGNPVSFRWSPPTYLDDATAPSPSAVAITRSITYALEVANEIGCTARDTVHLTVQGQVWVPDAFSPNGDGLNDAWVLPGIEAYPDARVTIFNRWGEVVYQSDRGYHQPFDGAVGGANLPAGPYAYTLLPAPDKPPLRGSVFIVRD